MSLKRFSQSFHITCPFSYHFLGVKNGLPQQIPMVFSTFPHPLGFPLSRGSETSTPSSKALVQTRRFFSPRRNWSICWFRTPVLHCAGRKIWENQGDQQKQNYILMYLDGFEWYFWNHIFDWFPRYQDVWEWPQQPFFSITRCQLRPPWCLGTYPRTQRQVGSQFWWCTPLVMTSAWHENSITHYNNQYPNLPHTSTYPITIYHNHVASCR